MRGDLKSKVPIVDLHVANKLRLVLKEVLRCHYNLGSIC